MKKSIKTAMLSTALMGALSLGVLTAPSSFAANQPAVQSTTVAPAPPFTDLKGSRFIEEITWVKTARVDSGYTDGTYRPLGRMTREQMATFLYRLVGAPAYTPPKVSPFQDINSKHPLYKEISWLYDQGILYESTFQPAATVSRGEMAAYMYRLTVQYCNLKNYSPKQFADADTSVYSREIAWAGGVKMETGDTANRFRPAEVTTREQMAYFSYNLYNYMIANGGCKPTTPQPPAPVSDTGLRAIDTNGSLWSYKSSGNTSLGGRSAIGSGWKDAKQILSVDWNNDGLTDILVRWSNGTIGYYESAGNNSYKSPVIVGNGWQNLEITASRLRNTDQQPGLVARNVVNGSLLYYPNVGGRMNSRIVLGSGWAGMTNLNVLDFDGDGKMDIIVRNPAGEMVTYRTNGAGVILNEPRKIIGWGWNVMDTITAESGFAGQGTTGLVSRTKSGDLFYYPVSGGKIGSATKLGIGWSGYKIAAGTPTVAIR